MPYRASFVLHTENIAQIKMLNREQKGDLLTAIFQYAAGEDITDMDGITEMAFSIIKMRLDKEAEKYDAITEKRREAGLKGGRPKKNDLHEKAKKTNGFFEKQNEEKKPDNDNVNVNDNDNNKKTLCKADADALFERLWKMYPCKRGKAQVSEANKRHILDTGFDAMSKAIERYKADLAKEPWRKPQNGSTFFHGGYEDYLDENYEPVKAQHAEKGESKFRNFEERSYDMDELTRELLGK